MKRLLSVILVVLVILNCSMVAYAEESQATEDSPVAVTTLEELQAAIAAAADGDTIAIGSTIFIEDDCTIGSTSKRITLICPEPLLSNLIHISGGDVVFKNVDFDGSNNNCPSTVIHSYNAKLDFYDCTFSENKEPILNVESGGDVSFVSCDFRNNRSITIMKNLYQTNGRFFMSDCTVIGNIGYNACFSINGAAVISDCLFQSNRATKEGGVIMLQAAQESKITNCQFIGNATASGSGAAIYTAGITTVSNCYFNGNSSGKAGNDICVWDGGTLSITDTDEQLSELYTTHDLQFIGAFKDEQNCRYDSATNSERIELPITNYTGAICFVAEEIPATEPDESTEQTEPPVNDNLTETKPTVPENTNSPEDDPTNLSVEVTNFEELVTAINFAQDGSTIVVKDNITISQSCVLGNADKRITLLCETGLSAYVFYIDIPGEDIVFNGIVFDGNKSNSSEGLIYLNEGVCVFNGCSFKNANKVFQSTSYGDVSFAECNFIDNANILASDGENMAFSGCSFYGNSGNEIGISISRNATFENCRFENNSYTYEYRGSGLLHLWDTAYVTISNCSFINNTNEKNCGGAIVCGGQVILSNCYFDGNNSDVEGNDIGCWETGRISIWNTDEELEALYAKHNRQYLGVYQDNQNNRYSADNQTEKLRLPLTENQNSICFASALLSVPEETTPPPAPSESEETDPPTDDDATETTPSVDDDAADTEPTIPEDTDLPEDEPANPPETEDSMVEETTDSQDRTQYIYYIPQTPATANTEPTATEESTTETTQGVTEQQNPYTGDTPVFAPEATGTPQEGASGEDEIDIALRELRVLVGILLVAEVLQFACFIIIWGLPMLKGIYKGRHKRRM